MPYINKRYGFTIARGPCLLAVLNYHTEISLESRDFFKQNKS